MPCGILTGSLRSLLVRWAEIRSTEYGSFLESLDFYSKGVPTAYCTANPPTILLVFPGMLSQFEIGRRYLKK